MCNFRIGEDVVALTDPGEAMSQPRKKGLIYKALDVMYCPKTGGQFVNVAGFINRRDTGLIRCDYCNGIHSNGNKYWTMSEHFAPLQTQSEEADMNEALQEVFERELFEVNH